MKCSRSKPLPWRIRHGPFKRGVSLLTDFAAAYPVVNHSSVFHVLEKAEPPRLFRRFLRSSYVIKTTEVEFGRENQRTIPHGQRCQAKLLSERLPIRSGVRPYLSMAPRLDHPKKPCRPTLFSTLSVCLC